MPFAQFFRFHRFSLILTLAFRREGGAEGSRMFQKVPADVVSVRLSISHSVIAMVVEKVLESKSLLQQN